MITSKWYFDVGGEAAHESECDRNAPLAVVRSDYGAFPKQTFGLGESDDATE